VTTDAYEPDAERWDAFMEWAQRFHEWDGFAEAERNYKLELGTALAEAREAFLSDRPDWRDMLRKVVGSPYVPVFRIMIFRFIDLLQSDPAMVADGLRSVWATGDSVPARERVRGFVESLSSAPQAIGTPEGLAAFLLLARDATSNPFYMWTPFNTVYRMTGYPSVSVRAPSADKYGHALDFLDEFIRQATNRGVHVRDRLDAQSLVWCVTEKGYFPDEWPNDVRGALSAYRESRGGLPLPTTTESTNGDGPAPIGDPDWPALATKLLWEPGHLDEIVADLEDKRQMIFYGPPGTGKTYVAKAIAEEYARVGGGFEIVQFHPSYSYEDFVEGYRPILDGNQAGFRLTQGPLKRIAAEAAANPDATYMLVIDELNRGNVAKVFGELYFLLEYRREEMQLQYSDDPFELPDNLLFICTMNTADRSIALVDAALRRRFWFQGFFPDRAPIEGLLRRWLTENQPGAEWVADLVDQANQHLDDPEAAIGPSYFMGDAELDDERVQRIWRRAVRPYVEEQCYGEDEKLRALEYDRLLSELAADATPPGAAPADGEDATGEPETERDDRDRS